MPSKTHYKGKYLTDKQYSKAVNADHKKFLKCHPEQKELTKDLNALAEKVLDTFYKKAVAFLEADPQYKSLVVESGKLRPRDYDYSISTYAIGEHDYIVELSEVAETLAHFIWEWEFILKRCASNLFVQGKIMLLVPNTEKGEYYPTLAGKAEFWERHSKSEAKVYEGKS